MWLTWGLTVVILTAWITKMIAQRQVSIKRTPLDLFILAFLFTQVISTLFTLDPRISIWGYYSRFNGGLLSTLAYIGLFYAFVSNLGKKELLRSLVVILISAAIVALWGLPSHFGYDPTCLLFRGTFDVSCWTDAFRPTIRIFSTLGQPAWMAAFLAALIPVTVSYLLNIWVKRKENKESSSPLIFIGLFVLTFLFYLDLLFTNTRGGFLAFWVANALYWAVIFIKQLIPKTLFIRSFLVINVLFALTTFVVGTPISQLNALTLSGIQNTFQSAPAQSQTPTASQQAPQLENNVTDSGAIRLHVWKGAIDAWLAHPVIGTGVETFAFAYYQYRPAAHNMTSEWDYLYNKAHNEYLNYLTTTGALGTIAYLSIIIVFLFFILRWFLHKSKSDEKEKKISLADLLVTGLTAGFISILISNFFGFSVVIINIYLFMFPLFALILLNKTTKTLSWTFPKRIQSDTYVSPYQWTGISLTILVGFYLVFLLIRFWQADTAYALGYNLNRAGDYQGAYVKLADAVKIRPAEPIFKDEYAINLATLGTALIQNNQATAGAQLAEQAVVLNNEITSKYPNNITFWKNRVRIFYFLSQIDPQYLKQALEAIEKAHSLAPTDAKISYNLGVLYGQNQQMDKAIEVLTQTVALKPNYRDAYYARGLFYRERALTQPEKLDEYNQKAKNDLEFILKNLEPGDETVKETLASWE